MHLAPRKQTVAAVRQSHISLIRSLVAYSFHDDAQNRRERAALLARQAFLLNTRLKGGVDAQVEDALHWIFRTEFIQEGPGHEADAPALVELVCQNVTFKKTLTQDEWKELVGTELDSFNREASC